MRSNTEPNPRGERDINDLVPNTGNWGRWGADDEKGTLNLVTPRKIQHAASLIQEGEVVSLSRPIPTTPAPGNPRPAHHYMERRPRGEGIDSELGTPGVAVDYIGMSYHGTATTHLDALCHAWGSNGMWNGRDGWKEIDFSGSRWAGIDAMENGIITRGVLLDIPKLRQTSYVTQDEPVQGYELEEAARLQGVQVEPGDALIVYCGRESWTRENGAYGVPKPDKDGSTPSVTTTRPGLDMSCLPILKQWDVSVLVWDMIDHFPNQYEHPWGVHEALYNLGLPLLDNALLEPLADACSMKQRADFCLMVAPLILLGGTGSPVNPLAIF